MSDMSDKRTTERYGPLVIRAQLDIGDVEQTPAIGKAQVTRRAFHGAVVRRGVLPLPERPAEHLGPRELMNLHAQVNRLAVMALEQGLNRLRAHAMPR